MIDLVKRYIISDGIHFSRRVHFGTKRFLSRSTARVSTKHGEVHYFAPNAKSYMRTATVQTKEPETIAWIDGFRDGECFWDIGANIGIYTIYAAVRPAMRVLAFEPSPANFAVLCKSVELNRMDDRVSTFCVALDDRRQLSKFNMKTTEAGFAGSALNTLKGVTGQHFEPSFRQAAIGYAIDGFIQDFTPDFPNHIKIDVDGNEHLVLAGAKETLRDDRLKSLLVELVGGERADKGAALLKEAGFRLDPASADARGNRIYRKPS